MSFEILNYDELPKNKTRNRISWRLIERGFIFKTKHEKYGCNDFEFINYNKNNMQLHLNYNGNMFLIHYANFKNGEIGRILKKHTNEFKIKTNDIIKDGKRDLTIIDREYRNKERENGRIEIQKWYKYKCNECGYEGWITEGSLLGQGTGCACCTGIRN